MSPPSVLPVVSERHRSSQIGLRCRSCLFVPEDKSHQYRGSNDATCVALGRCSELILYRTAFESCRGQAVVSFPTMEPSARSIWLMKPSLSAIS